jgi:hypothetical protein
MGYNRSGKKFRDRLKRHRRLVKRLNERDKDKTPVASAAPAAKQ